MAKNITGNGDGKNGSGNDTYKIGNRPTVPKNQVIQEINEGKHPNHHVSSDGNGNKFPKSNPDNTGKNNINK